MRFLLHGRTSENSKWNGKALNKNLVVRQRADPSSPTVLHSRWHVVFGQTNMTSATAVLCLWFQRTSQVDESTVSKAELKSKRTNIVTCCRFMLCKISSTTLKSPVSVLWYSLLYADWNTGYKLWSSKCLCNFSNISYKDLKGKARSMDIFRELTF